MSDIIGRYTLTARDIAERLGYNEQYVRTLAREGKLPAIKRIRQWLFDPAEIEAFLLHKTSENVNR